MMDVSFLHVTGARIFWVSAGAVCMVQFHETLPVIFSPKVYHTVLVSNPSAVTEAAHERDIHPTVVSVVFARRGIQYKNEE